MEYTRIILSGLMALLLAVPMCVCGSVIIPDKAQNTHSCCSHDDEEKESEECGDDCDCSAHRKLEFLSEDAEEITLLEYQKEGGNDYLCSYYVLKETLEEELNQFNAPPPLSFIADIPKRITLCTYRL